MATSRRTRRDTVADLDRLALKGMNAQELEAHRRTQLNVKVARIVEFGAIELQDAGASSYAAGVRAVIFTAIGTLSELNAPELQSDLERVKAYCDELLEDPPSSDATVIGTHIDA